MKLNVSWAFDENGSFKITKYVYPHELETPNIVNIVNDSGDENDLSHTFKVRIEKLYDKIKDIRKEKEPLISFKLYDLLMLNMSYHYENEDEEWLELMEDFVKRW
jgi:hypothetical protein